MNSPRSRQRSSSSVTLLGYGSGGAQQRVDRRFTRAVAAGELGLEGVDAVVEGVALGRHLPLDLGQLVQQVQQLGALDLGGVGQVAPADQRLVAAGQVVVD